MQSVRVTVPVPSSPPPSLAELPLMVQSVRVVVPYVAQTPPLLSRRVADKGAVGQRRRAVVIQAAAVDGVPPVIVSPEIDAVTPPSTWNTRLSPPPLIVTPAAGPVIVGVPLVSLSSTAAGQGDRLRRAEDRGIEDDRVGSRANWPGGSPIAGCPVLPFVGKVLLTTKGRQEPALLQRHQRRPHPPPFPGLDRTPPATTLISGRHVTHAFLGFLGVKHSLAVKSKLRHAEHVRFRSVGQRKSPRHPTEDLTLTFFWGR